MCCYLFLNLEVNFSWPSWTSKYVISSWNTLYDCIALVATTNLKAEYIIYGHVYFLLEYPNHQLFHEMDMFVDWLRCATNLINKCIIANGFFWSSAFKLHKSLKNSCPKMSQCRIAQRVNKFDAFFFNLCSFGIIVHQDLDITQLFIGHQ